MMSTFPAMLSADGLLGTPLPTFEAAGFTPWVSFPEDPFVFSPQGPIFANSSSDNSTADHRKSKSSNSGSSDPNPNRKKTPPVDERKQRRMISNRESARRSRMRKQKHLEILRNQVTRLKVGSRELMNRVRLVTHHVQLVRRKNDQLRAESVMLQQKLWDIRQVLLVRQLHQQLLTPAWLCNNHTSISEQIPPSLTT